MIGWFGVPGGYSSQSTKTHIVRNGKPICGTVIGDKQRFQWCSYSPRRNHDYIECEKCKRKL